MTASQKALVVIPARYESQRLPGKVLLPLAGKPLIYYVYQQAKKAKLAHRVLIATDSPLVEKSARAFGAEVLLTSKAHKNGTERVAEVAEKLPDYPLVVNLQGDEPDLPSEYLDKIIQCLRDHPQTPMATLAAPAVSLEEARSPDNVKVALDLQGRALYFSRSLLPYPRKDHSPFYRHIGVYGFQREFLLHLVTLAPTPLEQAESLEQLRALEHGHSIAVELVDAIPSGIDTQEDFLAFQKRWEEKNQP